jgi:cell division protein FtsN
MTRRTLSDITADDDPEAPTIPDRGEPQAVTPSRRRRAASKATASNAAAAPEPDPDPALAGRWRWQLGATARKAAAARARAEAAMADWERLVADAAAAGVPARLVVAAAADAGLDAPAAP